MTSKSKTLGTLVLEKLQEAGLMRLDCGSPIDPMKRKAVEWKDVDAKRQREVMRFFRDQGKWCDDDTDDDAAFSAAIRAAIALLRAAGKKTRRGK